LLGFGAVLFFEIPVLLKIDAHSVDICFDVWLLFFDGGIVNIVNDGLRCFVIVVDVSELL
jgi:hypothetical protein